MQNRHLVLCVSHSTSRALAWQHGTASATVPVVPVVPPAMVTAYSTPPQHQMPWHMSLETHKVLIACHCFGFQILFAWLSRGVDNLLITSFSWKKIEGKGEMWVEHPFQKNHTRNRSSAFRKEQVRTGRLEAVTVTVTDCDIVHHIYGCDVIYCVIHLTFILL